MSEENIYNKVHPAYLEVTSPTINIGGNILRKTDIIGISKVQSYQVGNLSHMVQYGFDIFLPGHKLEVLFERNGGFENSTELKRDYQERVLKLRDGFVKMIFAS